MTILDDAAALTSGDRLAEYGPPEESFPRVAQLWSAVLGHSVTPEEVGLCMIALKISRYASSGQRDSLVDIAGYAHCVARLAEKPT